MLDPGHTTVYDASVTILKYPDQMLACLSRQHAAESLDVARYAYVFVYALSGKHSAHWSRYFAIVTLVQ